MGKRISKGTIRVATVTSGFHESILRGHPFVQTTRPLQESRRIRFACSLPHSDIGTQR
jgi:hypothetical protein